LLRDRTLLFWNWIKLNERARSPRVLLLYKIIYILVLLFTTLQPLLNYHKFSCIFTVFSLHSHEGLNIANTSTKIYSIVVDLNLKNSPILKICNVKQAFKRS